MKYRKLGQDGPDSHRLTDGPVPVDRICSRYAQPETSGE